MYARRLSDIAEENAKGAREDEGRRMGKEVVGKQTSVGGVDGP